MWATAVLSENCGWEEAAELPLPAWPTIFDNLVFKQEWHLNLARLRVPFTRGVLLHFNDQAIGVTS